MKSSPNQVRTDGGALVPAVAVGAGGVAPVAPVALPRDGSPPALTCQFGDGGRQADLESDRQVSPPCLFRLDGRDAGELNRPQVLKEEEEKDGALRVRCQGKVRTEQSRQLLAFFLLSLSSGLLRFFCLYREVRSSSTPQ